MTVNSTCAPEVRWMLQQIEMIERSHDVLSPAHYARMRDLAAGRIKPTAEQLAVLERERTGE